MGATSMACIVYRQWPEATPYPLGSQQGAQKICRVRLRNIPRLGFLHLPNLGPHP